MHGAENTKLSCKPQGLLYEAKLMSTTAK